MFQYTKRITYEGTTRELIWHNVPFKEPSRVGSILSQLKHRFPTTPKETIYLLHRLLYEVDELTPYEQDRLKQLYDEALVSL